ETGILDGRRATTHWSAVAKLQARFPRIRVEDGPIYVRSGNIYTSCGMSAGFDLALHFVERDLGHVIAHDVAKKLVLFLHRPAQQRQLSAQLQVTATADRPLRELLSWIIEHPAVDLSLPHLAKRAAMSERNLTRVFCRKLGVTPARFIEKIRVEQA